MAAGQLCNQPLHNSGNGPEIRRNGVAGAETLDREGGTHVFPGFGLEKPFWEARRDAVRIVAVARHGGFRSGRAKSATGCGTIGEKAADSP